MVRTSSEQAKNSLFLHTFYQKFDKKEEPDDKGVRNFKKNLALSNKKSQESLQEEDMFDKRTIEPFKGSQRFNYFVFPVSNCENCRMNFKTSDTKIFIEKAMPEKKD